MDRTHDPARDQLVEEVRARLVDPLVELIGYSERPRLVSALEAAADPLMAQLRDDTSAHAVATSVTGALWEGAVQDTWWPTPLGRECARALAPEQTGSVTYAKAAAMLGLARGSIGPMIERGDLDRDPDGRGVLTSSVMHRLARPRRATHRRETA